MPQVGGGVCICAALVWGGREDQLLVQVGGGSPRLWRWRGIFWQAHVAYLIKKGLVQKLLTWLRRGSFKSCLLDWEGAHSKVAHLIEKGLVQKLGGLVIFLLLLVAAKSWWKQIRLRWYNNNLLTFSITLQYILILDFKPIQKVKIHRFKQALEGNQTPSPTLQLWKKTRLTLYGTRKNLRS